ncbi:hypothetical protein SAMN04488128_103798 [Chitinophaga eiseniae]|uniref:Uncharacterized protein n=1 Tax=Chitinophaga eiseniae TaxID=634771 RepID=A0A1T4SYC0_9BACT|nr:hypothetical protein SAMN04488128_103798 [Chitinophaga eiseniae]
MTSIIFLTDTRHKWLIYFSLYRDNNTFTEQ